MEETEFKKIAKPLLRFVEDYTLDLSYRTDLIAKYYHLTKKDRKHLERIAKNLHEVMKANITIYLRQFLVEGSWSE